MLLKQEKYQEMNNDAIRHMENRLECLALLLSQCTEVYGRIRLYDDI